MSKSFGSDSVDKYIERNETSFFDEIVNGDFGAYETTDGREFKVGEGGRDAAREHQQFLNRKR